MERTSTPGGFIRFGGIVCKLMFPAEEGSTIAILGQNNRVFVVFP